MKHHFRHQVRIARTPGTDLDIMPHEWVRLNLGTVLEPINIFGRFAAFWDVEETAIKPIFVKGVEGVGRVVLPIRDNLIKGRLVQGGEQVFPGVSEFDATKVTLSNGWASTLDDLATRAAKELGISSADFGNVQLHLRKFMISAPGAVYNAFTQFVMPHLPYRYLRFLRN